MSSSEIIRTATEMARLFAASGNLFASSLGGQLTCSEAEALTALLEACGEHEAATELMDWHAQSDEPDERHYVPSGAEEPEPMFAVVGEMTYDPEQDAFLESDYDDRNGEP